ncbi:MAG: hypothetical protein NUV53_05255 [Patescibacteria group bacterium]|nr:hypothetical protein [Patescibacteria group bacterium]
MKISKIYIIVVAFILIVGYGVYRNSLESKKYHNEISIKQDQIDKEVGEWSVYRNDEYGFEFKYPARFTVAPESAPWSTYNANFTLVAFESIDPEISFPNELFIVSRFPIPSGKSFRDVFFDNTFFDPSGLRPVSLSEFTKKTINGREFYAIRTSRFEGTLAFAYYLVEPSFVYRFDALEQGVDWMNPDLDEENNVTHTTLRKVLNTLSLIQ